MLENLTAVIPYRDGQATIGRLLDCLPEGLPILVVDDQSKIPYVPDRPAVRVLRMRERGYFAGACNAGIAACGTDVLILNQDIILEGTAWQDLLTFRSAYAMGGDKVARHRAFPAGYAQGTFMWLRRDAIERLGTVFDQAHYPLWGGTALVQLRLARMGYAVLPIPMAEYGMVHARGEAPYGSSIAATLEAEADQRERLLRTPPAISVIITCYNYAKFLPDAVASLIGGPATFGDLLPPQTFQSFEVIIVDDASTDETALVGDALADPWKAIRFFRSPQNIGSAAAANLGIEKAHGKYVTVLDADDMMHETRLERLYATAVTHTHALIYDDCLEVATDRKTLLQARPSHGETVTQYHSLSAVPLRLPAYNFDRLLQRNGIHKGIFIERRAWEETGGYPAEFKDGREDWAFNIALGAKGYCGIHVPETLYIRRQHGGNRHLRNTNAYWRDVFMSQLRTRYPDLYAGKRSAMCCGNKTQNNNGGGAAAQTLKAGRLSMAAAAGEQSPTDMVLLEYQLQKAGTKTFVGPVSHRTYAFGGQRKQGYVDARDVTAMLSLIENHQPVFKRASAAPAPAAPVSVAPAVAELVAQSEARMKAWEEVPSATADAPAELVVKPEDQAIAAPAPTPAPEVEEAAEDPTPAKPKAKKATGTKKK